MFKKMTPAALIVIIIVVACIVWCFVYPENYEPAVAVGGVALFYGFFFGGFDSN